MILQQLVFRSLQNFKKSKPYKKINHKTPPQNPPEPYIHPYNYNLETHKDYTQQQKKALQNYEIIQQALNSEERIVPRRSRRTYDRPKHDKDISNYAAWRSFDRPIVKRNEGEIRVVAYIPIVPKDLVHAFGWGAPAWRDTINSTYEYEFEDINYDVFHIYDYKATQEYFGPNKSNYKYNDQEHIRPRNRIKKWPSKDEFWTKLDEPYNFRLNCQTYADFRKFKVWLIKEVENSKNRVSFSDISLQKYKKLETYDDYDKNYEIDGIPTVMQIGKSYWLQEGETLDPKKLETNLNYQKFLPPVKLDESYRVAKQQQNNK